MGVIYEDERYFSVNDVNRFDAEKFDRFIDCLAHDIDRYTADAKILENGYGKYYHNTTYVGQAANASKEFIDRKQFDKFHVESKEVQKELFYKCTDVRDMFREQVDSSPKARIDSETLEFIKRDYRDYYDELEHEGYDIECMAREIENYYGKYGKEVTQPNYRRSMEVYDELCCHGGFMDKCIRKFENFNEDARQHMKRSMIKEHSYDLQKDIKATASSLEGMTVFKTEVERQSVWVNALNASNVVVDPEKLATDIREIIKLSGLKYDKNALIDANIIKTATNLALLNCKSKDEKVLVQKCSASMVSAAAIGPISWDVIYGMVAAAIKAIGASQPWAIAITAFVLLICFVLSCSHDIKRGFERFVSSKEKEENSHIIEIPPKEDKKTIIEGPTAVPQGPSVTDIPSGNVEKKEVGREIMPKSPTEEQPKIYQGKKNNGNNDEKVGTRPPNLTPEGAKRRGAFREAKRRNGIPNSQQPKQGPNHDRDGKIQPGREYRFEDGTVIREDSAGHEYPDDPIQNRGPHFNDPSGNHYDY